MKKTSSPKEAKYFKYQFSPLMIGLAVAILLLCVVGISISIYRIVTFGIRQFSDTLQAPLLIFISLFCILVVLSLLIKSQYIIDDTYYTVQFGFIKSKSSIKDVTAMELDSDTKKLTVYIGEEYSVLSLSPAWQDEFISAMQKANPNISFSFTLAEKNDKE